MWEWEEPGDHAGEERAHNVLRHRQAGSDDEITEKREVYMVSMDQAPVTHTIWIMVLWPSCNIFQSIIKVICSLKATIASIPGSLKWVFRFVCSSMGVTKECILGLHITNCGTEGNPHDILVR